MAMPSTMPATEAAERRVTLSSWLKKIADSRQPRE
jgi:hypothetical protein